MILKEQFKEVFDPFIKKTLPGPHMNTGKTVCPNFSLHEDIRVFTYPMAMLKNLGGYLRVKLCARAVNTQISNFGIE